MRLLKVMGQWGDGLDAVERGKMSHTQAAQSRHLSKVQLGGEIEGGSQAKVGMRLEYQEPERNRRRWDSITGTALSSVVCQQESGVAVLKARLQ